MKSIKFRVPIKLELGKRTKKTRYLNLNNFRNNPHYLNNDIKREYHKVVEEVLEAQGITPGFALDKQVRLTYELFIPNRVKRDISNVLSIVDKNVSDSLVEFGILTDDNYLYVTEVHYLFGGLDEAKEGYVDVTLEVLTNG